MDMSLSKLWEILKDREVWRATVQAESWTKVGLKEPDTAQWVNNNHIEIYLSSPHKDETMHLRKSVISCAPILLKHSNFKK